MKTSLWFWSLLPAIAILLAGSGRLLAADAPAPGALGKIAAGKSQVLAKDAAAWQTKGRVVGVAKTGPQFTITVVFPAALQRANQVVEAEKTKVGNYVYEIWLDPGVYQLTIAAPGYSPLELKGLEVRAGGDLRTDLEFTPAK